LLAGSPIQRGRFEQERLCLCPKGSAQDRLVFGQKYIIHPIAQIPSFLENKSVFLFSLWEGNKIEKREMETYLKSEKHFGERGRLT
jgi:hypothetical protein